MSDTTLATRDELLSPYQRRYDYVTLPIKKATLRIQSLTEQEVNEFQNSLWNSDGTRLRRSKLDEADRRFVTLCIVDESGNRMLNDADIATLAKWDRSDLYYLYSKCSAHVGMKMSDIEEMIKNSEKIAVED
jgi:hypothetical protein